MSRAESQNPTCRRRRQSRWIAITALITVLSSIGVPSASADLPAEVVGPELAVGQTYIWDRDFSSFTTSSDFSSGCTVSPLGDGSRRMTIAQGAVRSTSKPGADCSIFRSFDLTPQPAQRAVFFAAATGSTGNVNNEAVVASKILTVPGSFRARLKISGWNGSNQLNECNSDILVDTLDQDIVIPDIVCVLPENANIVKVAFRARQDDVNAQEISSDRYTRSIAWGRATLSRMVFQRLDSVPAS